MGASEYGRDRFNLFDAAVVLLSIVEMAMGGGGLAAGADSRSLRSST